MSIDQILRNELTPQQYDAAVDTAREVLCLACAGSGKSRTLAYRIAADCCFRGPHPYSEQHPWDTYGETVEKWGLVWGGRFRSPDRPHAELKP